MCHLSAFGDATRRWIASRRKSVTTSPAYRRSTCAVAVGANSTLSGGSTWGAPRTLPTALGPGGSGGPVSACSEVGAVTGGCGVRAWDGPRSPPRGGGHPSARVNPCHGEGRQAEERAASGGEGREIWCASVPTHGAWPGRSAWWRQHRRRPSAPPPQRHRRRRAGGRSQATVALAPWRIRTRPGNHRCRCSGMGTGHIAAASPRPEHIVQGMKG